jgi:hypothetical protein
MCGRTVHLCCRVSVKTRGSSRRRSRSKDRLSCSRPVRGCLQHSGRVLPRHTVSSFITLASLIFLHKDIFRARVRRVFLACSVSTKESITTTKEASIAVWQSINSHILSARQRLDRILAKSQHRSAQLTLFAYNGIVTHAKLVARDNAAEVWKQSCRRFGVGTPALMVYTKLKWN